MKELFLAVTAKLKTITALRWIDEDYGQADNYQLRPAIEFPAALVTVNYDSTEDTGEAIDMEQHVRASVQVRLVFETTGETNTYAPDTVRQQALARFDIVDQVHEYLQSFDNLGKMAGLTRTSMQSEPRRDGYKVVAIRYVTDFTEAY
ncbi:MAG: hypothetical protein HC819_14895 [Cyclobacteriaceae bacterium]|nr:hypothetical protein [Cyclobacteriaceae bacterium]